MRYLTYSLFAAGWLLALVTHGGVDPKLWNWSALLIAAAGLLSVLASRRGSRPVWNSKLELVAMLLLVWTALALVPLPPQILQWLSPTKVAQLNGAQATLASSQADAWTPSWTPWSASPVDTWTALRFGLPALLTLFLGRVFAVWFQNRPWLLFLPILVGAGFEATLALLQAYVTDMRHASESISGTYANRNHLAGLLEMALPMFVAWFWLRIRKEGNRRRHRGEGYADGEAWEEEYADPTEGWAIGQQNYSSWRAFLWRGKSAGWMRVDAGTATLGIGALLSFLAILASQSRGGLIATLVGLVGMGLLFRRESDSSRDAENNGQTPAARHRKMLLAIAAAGVLCILFSSAGAGVLERFRDLQLHSWNEDTRALIWRDSWNLFKDNWLVGVGFGGYRAALYPYKTAAPISTVDYAHNDYLQLASEFGVIGLVLLAALVWTCLRGLLVTESSLDQQSGRSEAAGRRSFASDQASLPAEWRAALFGSMLAIATHSLFDFNLYIPVNLNLVALLGGICSCLPPREKTVAVPLKDSQEILVSTF